MCTVSGKEQREEMCIFWNFSKSRLEVQIEVGAQNGIVIECNNWCMLQCIQKRIPDAQLASLNLWSVNLVLMTLHGFLQLFWVIAIDAPKTKLLPRGNLSANLGLIIEASVVNAVNLILHIFLSNLCFSSQR